MKSSCLRLVCLFFVAMVLFAHGESRREFPRDTRPFGKYLYAICTVSDAKGDRCEVVDRCLPGKPGNCSVPAPRPSGVDRITQSISVSLACNFAQPADCDPTYPVVAGHDFYVQATSDSGQDVEQDLKSGNAEQLSPPGEKIVRYHADRPGTIVITAKMKAKERQRGQRPKPPVDREDAYLPAPPVDLVIQVVAKPDEGCSLLPSASPAQSSILDATGIVSLLGNPTPFTLTAQSPNVIAIYTNRRGVNAQEENIFRGLIAEIGRLSNQSAGPLGVTTPGKPFTVELRIPHASSLGDLATRLGALNFSQFSLQDVGRDAVRITSPATPDCKTWTTFLNDIKHLEWNVASHSMSTKLFYLSSSDVATAFTGLAPSSTSSSGSTSGSSSGTSSSGGSSSSSGGGSSASSSAPAAGAATISVSQPPGSNIQISSDSTACVNAGLASGNPALCAPAASSSSGGGSSASSSSVSSPGGATPAPLAPLQMTSMAVAAGTGEQNPPDLLVFADADPGDDAQVSERLRILAQLDLPRPEMIISAWVAQNSSTNQVAVAAFSDRVKTLVADYNREFELVVYRAWNALKSSAGQATYYNPPFRRYVSNLFIADTYKEFDRDASPQQKAQDFLDYSQAHIAKPAAGNYRQNHQICDEGQYCLGYTSLFRDRGLNPTLTDLLMTLIAAQDPVAATDIAVQAVEGDQSHLIRQKDQCPGDRCKAIWDTLSMDQGAGMSDEHSCTARDMHGILGTFFSDNEPRVHLNCFTQETRLLLAATAQTPPYPVGLLRAALADFLFNYKMSQQFPHEFDAYELTQSANRLNTALNPLVDAFNRDLTAYQLFVRADVKVAAEQLNSAEGRCCVKRLFGLDKPSFYNDGLVTVRTISGQPTSVNTTSQSYLNASTAPQLSAVLGSLLGQPGSSSSGSGSSGSPSSGSSGASGSGGSGSGGGSGPALLMPFIGAGPVAGLQAFNAVLSQYQSTYAQIGRSLNLTVTPRSLSTASSAEIAVQLNADEGSTTPPTYSGAGLSNPALNTSRVAAHDVSTRVRVDSVKMFELSSFTAIVQRARGRFPLLPPFVEIPYIGTFAGIPMGAAKEFHNSTAVLTAYVVPTAADLAFGVRFDRDLIVDGANDSSSKTCQIAPDAAPDGAKKACAYRYIYSFRDVWDKPLRAFNRDMIECFKSNTTTDGCSTAVTFDSLRKFARD